MIETIKLFIND